jgi:DHA2 family multidrug resistance protein
MAAASSSATAVLDPHPAPAQPALARPSSHKWLITIAVMLGTMLEVLDSSIVNVSLPHMQGSFSASVDEVTWILTSYIVAAGIMVPLTGWISTRLGRKRYFLISVILFVIASGLCGVAGSISQMVVFRLLQGAAGAAMMPSSQAILMETFPPEEQGMAMAMWGMGLLTAPMLGPTLGGWITDNWNWRWNFYINLPTGTIAAIMVYAFVDDPEYLRKAQSGARRVDYLGIVYLVLGLGLLQIVMDRGQRAGWFSAPWVCVFTAVAAVAIVLLVWREVRFPEPILDLTILQIPQFTISVVIVLAMMLAVYGLNLLNPLFFQDLLGYPAWKSGLAVMPRGFATMLGMLLIGGLSRRGTDTRWLVGVGFALLGYSLWTMGGWTLGIAPGNMLWPMLLSGLGTGFIFPIMSAATLSCVGPERMGYAASLYNMMRNTGAAVGISLVVNLLNSFEQVHQSFLGEHFTIFDAWRLDHASAHMLPGAPHLNLTSGTIAHQAHGLGLIYGAIRQQASLLAFNDAYRMLATVAVLFVPAFLLLKKPRGAGGAVVH